MSDDRFRFDLDHPMGRQNAAQCLRAVGEGFICEIRRRTRLESQNAKFHAMLGDISRQYAFKGRVLVPKELKVVFISGHAMATGLGQELVTGLEGEMVNIRESSASMTVSRMNSLISYTDAWGADHSVHFGTGNGYDEERYQR